MVIFVYVLLRYQADGWSEPVPGVGGAMLVSREKGGLYVDDDALKKATTDALGVAAKMLGLGADVYSGNADWSKYSNAYLSAQQAREEKPSEHPPPSEKELQRQKCAEIMAWLDGGTATEKQIAGMVARSAELVQEGKLTQRDQRKLHTEFLIRISEWDQAQEHLVRCENNRYLTKKQVEAYMERIDAGRAGQ